MSERSEQTEYLLHQGEAVHRGNGVYSSPDEDERAMARHHDHEKVWTVESYDPKLTRRMLELGATVRPSKFDGHLFTVDARQLIEFIAAASGLNVEFRARKRQQLSPEKAEARRLRMAAMNAKQRVKV
jgi:hypothetical protein